MSKYKDFFYQVGLFRKKQSAQKQRGLNDYNLLTTVLSSSDEVRLHTRVIHSLLDPQGLHYQGALFLELFLGIIHFDDFDFKRAYVGKEHEQIDLYITADRKHIIIENKIYAKDQENQIKRYLEKIRKQNKHVDADNILVIYLTLDRNQPSKFSLGGLEISSGYLLDGNEKISRYKSIDYKKEVLSWLEKCRYEVQNISNLNESLKQYINVVKSLNNINTNKTMQLSDYLRENINDEHVDIIEEILSTFQNRDNVVIDFFKYFENNMIERIEKECNLDSTWEVRVQTENLWSKNWRPITVGRRNWFTQAYYVAYGWEVETPSKGNSYYGIFIEHDNSTHMDFSTIHNKRELSEFKQDDWWPLWTESYNTQSVKDLVLFYCKKEETAKIIADKMISLIKDTMHEMEEINQQLMNVKEG